MQIKCSEDQMQITQVLAFPESLLSLVQTFR